MSVGSSSVQEISFFQLDNLVRNRIPFVLLSLGVDISGFYDEVVYQNHLISQTISTTRESILKDLSSKNVLSESAVILVCPRGDLSIRLKATLEQQGYRNVYLVRNGFAGLLKDRP